MKAPPFAYVRAATLAEVLHLLEARGEGARLLAGGQSLLATLNLRLSAPELLIDITHIAELGGIAASAGKIRIGATVTHAEVERSPQIAQALPLLAQAAPHIAHVAIRNVGTFGGSIAMADPAAEWPACCLALDAQFVIAGKNGNRRVSARDFFKGLYQTELKPAEVLTAVEIPLPQRDYRSVFLELARRRGDFATVGVAAVAKKNARDTLSDVRLAYLGVGPTPVLARAAMGVLEGQRLSPAAVAAAVQALAADLDPPADSAMMAATKLHLARVLTGRTLAALAA